MMRHSYSSQVAPESIITAVDCQNQVRSWRLLRSLMDYLIPTCSCALVVEEHEADHSNKMIYHHQNITYLHRQRQASSKRGLTISNNMVTGTMYGYRGGKMCFSIQTTHNSSSPPLLLLELVVPRKTLAREMQGGILHIELKNETLGRRADGVVWSMYCNGKKVGVAVKRRAGVEDSEMLRLMGWVESGAGTITKGRREVVYLRARFERACGPFDVESFHLIDPEGCIGQELSITFHS